MKKDLYVTPEMIKQFHRTLNQEGIALPDVPATLAMMCKRGLLSENPLPIPELDGRMSPREFMKAYDRIPFNANPVMEEFPAARKMDNRVIFRKEMDVICNQHISSFHYIDQTMSNVYTFTYLYQGNCHYLFEKTEITLKAGDIFIASPGFSHVTYTAPDTFAMEVMVRSSIFQILISDLLTSDTSLSHFFRSIQKDQKNGYYCILHGNTEDDELRFYLQSIACECLAANPYSNSCALSLLRLFLARAFLRYDNTLTLYRHRFNADKPDARSILRYIQVNYQHVSLAQVADYFHYNKAYLSRFIHEHFGQSFITILTDLKITHAKEFLTKTDLKVTEIAELVGYDSLDHFSRLFKKKTGMSPAAFRRQHTGL